MSRTTISISDDLKRRMDRVKEAVNWSAIAAQAFELKLGELAQHRKEKNMSNVIERLRASKLQGGSNAERQGREMGTGWAKDAAAFSELKRLSKLDRDSFFDETNWPASEAFGPAEMLALKILGEDAAGDRTDATNFWEQIVGNDENVDGLLESLDFLRGFAEGALSIYEQVADSL